MTTLRERMTEDLRLRGMSANTQRTYIGAVRQLARHYAKPPDRISENKLRQYFLYLKNELNVPTSSFKVALSGIKFFYRHTLERDWTTLNLARPAKEKRLPVVLSVEEVCQILSAIRCRHYRVCLTTIYSCGLRRQEGLDLKVGDIDSARMMIHVRCGKGAKDRYVPLPKRMLDLLRGYWATHRNPIWIFPRPQPSDAYSLATASKPMSGTGMLIAFKDAVAQCGIRKSASIQTIRHSWVTHLLEAGVNPSASLYTPRRRRIPMMRRIPVSSQGFLGAEFILSNAEGHHRMIGLCDEFGNWMRKERMKQSVVRSYILT